MLSWAELMFYAEAEGKLPTRIGRLNAVIQEIKDTFPAGSEISQQDIKTILKTHGIINLTLSEERYIQKGLNT